MRLAIPLAAVGARPLLRERARIGLGLLLMFGLLGCREQVLAPSGAVSLQTDASAYIAIRNPGGDASSQYSMEMVVAVSNGTASPVTLQGCADNADGTPRFALSMAATKNDWAPAYEDVTGCPAPVVITLAVGESRVNRIVLTAPRLFDASTGLPLGELEGRMRLVYYVDGLTLWSNAFEVRLDSPTP